MRRPLVALLVLSGIPAFVRAQSGAPLSPTFHAGQWAAEFAVSSGFSGLGALRFSTPTKAWTLSVLLSGQFSDVSGNNSSGDLQNVTLNVGRRWYRPGAGRVRPFAGAGVLGNFARRYSKAGANDQLSRGYGGGFFGQLGAAVFFAPELSLGASWRANLTAGHQGFYLNGTLQNDVTNFGFDAGSLAVQGAFYF